MLHVIYFLLFSIGKINVLYKIARILDRIYYGFKCQHWLFFGNVRAAVKDNMQ